MLRILLTLLSILVWREDAAGASYYISPTGTDGSGCTIGSPCATFPGCNSVMSAGDTCYARAGTYTTSGLRGWTMTGSGGTSLARKTFRGYPGETAIIQPTSFFNSAQEGTITIYSNLFDYVTFSDFTFYGRFDINEPLTEAADYITLERILFKCPGAAGTGNTTNIESQNKIDGSSNTPREYLTIRNNKFTIDSTCPSGVYDFDGSSTSYQPDFMHLYANSHPIIENNDFIIEDYTKMYDRGSDPDMRFAIWLKGRAEYAEIRYNYCAGEFSACYSINTGKCPAGYTCSGESGTQSAGQNTIHHNISNRGGALGWDSNNWSSEDFVYNNTIYRPLKAVPGIIIGDAQSDTTRSRTNHNIFNNLIVSQAGDTLGDYYGYIFLMPTPTSIQGDLVPCYQTLMDYNIYWPVTAAKPANFKSYSQSFSTLTAWKTWLAANCPSTPGVRETNSRSVDPLFVNASMGDFHLQPASPARTGGRGVGYPSYLGAIDPINGTTIGCTFDPACYGYTAPVNNPRTKVR